jgi:hypothetical protein
MLGLEAIAGMAEAAFMAVVMELAVVGIILLVCRAKGWRVPSWTGLAWLNRFIEPKDRLHMVLALLR